MPPPPWVRTRSIRRCADPPRRPAAGRPRRSAARCRTGGAARESRQVRSAGMSDTTVVWGEIDGREITFPMEVEEMNSATLLFSVPVEAAAALLPGDAFEIVEIAPGTAQLVIAACDYVRNPWGDYNELNLGFLARPAGASPDVIGSFVYRMPVDQAFTCAAGNQVMGFPKTVQIIDTVYR